MIASSRRCRRSDARFCASSSTSRLVLGAPREHRLREDVVEDLVADRAALLDASGGSAARRASTSTGAASSTGTSPKSARSEISCAIFVPDGVTRWLKSRAAMSFCVRRELGHRAFEMLLDDVLRAAETLERRRRAASLDPAARSSSQMRCMTSWRYGASIRGADLDAFDRAEPAERRLDLAGADLVEHALDERRLDGDATRR